MLLKKLKSSLYIWVFFSICTLSGSVTSAEISSASSSKIIIAHGVPGNGLNSRASFENALNLNPDYIESDLQLTKDGILICLHDPTLEKITEIESVFPNRFKLTGDEQKKEKKWFINDFTLSEIRTLKGTQDVVILDELLELVKNKAGLYLETKDPLIYRARGLDIDLALHDFLSTQVFEKPTVANNTPIIIESFHEISLQRLRELGGDRYTLIQLVWFSTWHKYMSAEGLKYVATYANGIGPLLSMVLPPSQQVVADAHAQNLVVHAWKGYEAVPPKGLDNKTYADYLLYRLGIDGLMTSTPDQVTRY